jgi:hypothetical protein
MKELALLNTTIVTTDGSYVLRTVTLEEAKKLVQVYLYDNYLYGVGGEREGICSYIGHSDTVMLLSTLLNEKVEFNRGLFEQRVGQEALCFKLRTRVESGAGELTVEDLERIGFDFKVLTRVA